MASSEPCIVYQDGDLCRNGDDAAQADFLKKFYQTYDRIKLTELHPKYLNELRVARTNNKTQVDWSKATELLKDMSGMNGASYSAVLRWIITALDDDDIKNSITTSECKQLLDLCDEACGWRNRQFNVYDRKGKADDGHRYALKMWKDVRNKLEEVKEEVTEKLKTKFNSDNNNFEKYNNLFK
ncbi:hypothetical protein HA402_002282 [Bradysia odoriphaga]|nr:hypothetical protein HA402_002282 [Bradysia odoriphaga]